jgi:hypothetical protein
MAREEEEEDATRARCELLVTSVQIRLAVITNEFASCLGWTLQCHPSGMAGGLRAPTVSAALTRRSVVVPRATSRSVAQD